LPRTQSRTVAASPCMHSYELTIPIKGSRPTGQLHHSTMPARPLHRVVMPRSWNRVSLCLVW
jgi:hypothetical protein